MNSEATFECSLYGLLDFDDYEKLVGRLKRICGDQVKLECKDSIYVLKTKSPEGQEDNLVLKLRETINLNEPNDKICSRVLHYGHAEPLGKHPTTVRTSTSFLVDSKESGVMLMESLGYDYVSTLETTKDCFVYQDMIVIELVELKSLKEEESPTDEDSLLVYVRSKNVSQEQVTMAGNQLLRFSLYLAGIVLLRPVDHRWLAQTVM